MPSLDVPSAEVFHVAENKIAEAWFISSDTYVRTSSGPERRIARGRPLGAISVVQYDVMQRKASCCRHVRAAPSGLENVAPSITGSVIFEPAPKYTVLIPGVPLGMYA